MADPSDPKSDQIITVGEITPYVMIFGFTIIIALLA